jgi:aldose 1-epimerase
MGSDIGHYAGGISKVKFKIEGKVYKLHNANGVILHGGKGFAKKYKSLKTQTYCTLILNYNITHLADGFTGKLIVEDFFKISENNSFILSLQVKKTSKILQ